MSRDVYEALKSDVGPKVADFVEAVVNFVEAEQNQERDLLYGEIARLNVQVGMAEQRIAELEGKEPTEDPTKYILTKKKLVQFMKDNGWYD
jgi:hypothetical protein